MSPPAATSPPPAQENTEGTPNSSLFDRVLKRAGSYFTKGATYLAAISAFIIAWIQIFGDTEWEDATFTHYVKVTLAALPLLIALSVEAWVWRERRRKRLLIRGQSHANYFRLGPREAKDHDGFQLPDNIHQTVVDWVRAAPHPILHLTGSSGTGKSSLLQAWLIPVLEKAGTHRVLRLRSFEDPAQAMRTALLGVWDQPPAKLQKPDLPLPDLLQNAVAYLEKKDQCLLIIFDQFEEFFLLNPVETQLQALRDVFHWVLKEKLPGLTLLLSYREDHSHLLATLRLPPVSIDPSRNLDVNGVALRPFTIAEARKFFEDSGLPLSPERLELALLEAASYEETRAHIRPIVINVLGRILVTLSENPEAWRRKRGLIRTQVRQWALCTDLREDIRPVLEKLLSSSGTVAPCDEQTLGTALGASRAARLPAALNDLQINGLIRCLSPEELDAGKRIWQINHDFLARLLALIVEGLQKTLWRQARPWLAPASAALWFLAVFVILPQMQEKQRLVEEREGYDMLRALGFEVELSQNSARLVDYSGKLLNGPAKTLPHTTPPVTVRFDQAGWPMVLEALRKFHCRHLDLAQWSEVHDLTGLESLRELEELKLENAPNLERLPDLRGLPQLRKLHLHSSHLLHRHEKQFSFAGLKQLKALTLWGWTELEDLRPLAALQSLQTLYLTNCTGLEGAEAFSVLEGLVGLQTIDLDGCPGLERLPDLRALKGLQRLSLTGCNGLKGAAALSTLTGLAALQELNLTGCSKLERLPNLRASQGLQTLYLSGCTALKGTDAFSALTGLVGLQELYLSGCTGLERLPDLRASQRLQNLYLSDCTGLKGAEALSALTELTGLKRLNLSFCTGLERLPDLRALQGLEEVYLGGCTGLKGAEAIRGLTGLTGLRHLDLAGCTGLESAVVAALRTTLPEGCEVWGP